MNYFKANNFENEIFEHEIFGKYIFSNMVCFGHNLFEEKKFKNCPTRFACTENFTFKQNLITYPNHMPKENKRKNIVRDLF